MGQYYNDKIESGINKISDNLFEKNIELKTLVGKEFSKYVKNNKIPNQKKFFDSFNEIYKTDDIKAKNETFNKQYEINVKEESKNFDGVKIPPIKKTNITEYEDTFEYNLSLLKIKAYQTLMEMVYSYEDLKNAR